MTLQKTVGLAALGVSLGITFLSGLGDRAVTIAQSVPSPAPSMSPLPSSSTPYVPTPDAVISGTLKLAGITRDDVVYDLGSGDGGLIIAAVKDYGARRGAGVDVDAGLVQLSNENAQKAGVSDRAQFVRQDRFQTDLHEATVVSLNLPPDVSLKLRPTLLSDLKPGTRIVSRTASLGDWKPDKTIAVAGTPSQTLYYWVVPTKLAGDWQGRIEYAPGRNQPYTFRFTQQFQQVKGDVIADGKKYNIPNIVLTGDRLTFNRTETIQGQPGAVQFNGRVEGDTLKGTAGVRWGILARNFAIVAKRSSNRAAK